MPALAHTTARDPHEKFAFRFPDVNGKQVSQDDPYFKDNVVLAIVTGTWCPNCHDEAQYLVELDRKYRDQGLRIVALDFEEAEQQGSLARVHAFVKQYGVKYPYLIAGAPSDMWEKVPQLVNLNTWPASVFVGRDGTVRAVAGYRISECLAWGRFLYVDDLVTLSADQAAGFGSRLFDWIVAQAEKHGCDQVHLDSGVQRHGAHRFYLHKGLDITSYHLAMRL